MISAATAFRTLVSQSSPSNPRQIATLQKAFENAIKEFAKQGVVDDENLRGQLARAISPSNSQPATVMGVDLNGDSHAELLASVPVDGLIPIVVTGQSAEPFTLLPSSNSPSAKTSIARTYSFQVGRPPDVVLVRTTEGASATNTEILVVRWTGRDASVLFDQTISDWAGDANWQIDPSGSIVLTCPASGIYDHKLLLHPRQVRSYRWSGSAFSLVSRHTDAPNTRRQMMNLAEADFFAGDVAKAVVRYRSVVNDSSLTDEQDVPVDWQDFARLRLGEIAALSDNQPDADRWLTEAAKAGPPLGSVASAFSQAYHLHGPTAGFAAIQGSSLPVLFERSQMGTLGFPVTLGAFGALGQGVAWYLDHAPSIGTESADEISTSLASLGLQVRQVTVADLDVDGKNEIAAIVPFGQREQTVWLFVQTGGRWKPTATLEAPNGLGSSTKIDGGRQAILVNNLTGAVPSVTYLTWDGHAFGVSAATSAAPSPLSVNFYRNGDQCDVAEDLP